MTARVHVFAPYMHAHVCVCTIHACTHVFLSPRAAIPTCSHGPGKALNPAPGQQAGRQRCGCCLPPRPHLVAAEADVEVVEILEALGGEAGATGKGRAGGQRREVVVQDLAWQCQGEAAVVVAEGAELGGAGGGSQGQPGAGVTRPGTGSITYWGWLGSSLWGQQRAGITPQGQLGGGGGVTLPRWPGGLVSPPWVQLGIGITCPDSDTHPGWPEALVSPTQDGRGGLVSPLWGPQHHLFGMAGGGAGITRGDITPPPHGPTPPGDTGRDRHLVAAGAGAAGVAGGGPVGGVTPQVGAGWAGLAGARATVHGIPRGTRGAGSSRLRGAASAEGCHPSQHISDVDRVQLGHVAGVPPALAPRAPVTIAHPCPPAPAAPPGGYVTPCPSPPRGRGCAGKPR